MIEEAIEKFEEREGNLPNILTLYFVSLDHKSHCDGSENSIKYLKDIDKMLGEYFFDKIKKKFGFDLLEKDDIIFVVVSDHGHSPVINKDKGRITQEELASMLQKDKRVKLSYIISSSELDRLENKKSKEIIKEETPLSAKPEESNVILALNGGFAHIYIRKNWQSNTWGSWYEQPDLSNDIIPIAKIIDENPVGVKKNGKKDTKNYNDDYILKKKDTKMILMKDINGYTAYHLTGKQSLTEYFEEEDRQKISSTSFCI